MLTGQFPPYRKWLFRDPPVDLPDVDAALSGETEALGAIQEALEPELREHLDEKRVEKPYLHQPAFEPLG